MFLYIEDDSNQLCQLLVFLLEKIDKLSRDINALQHIVGTNTNEQHILSNLEFEISTMLQLYRS